MSVVGRGSDRCLRDQNYQDSGGGGGGRAGRRGRVLSLARTDDGGLSAEDPGRPVPKVGVETRSSARTVDYKEYRRRLGRPE